MVLFLSSFTEPVWDWDSGLGRGQFALLDLFFLMSEMQSNPDPVSLSTKKLFSIYLGQMAIPLDQNHFNVGHLAGIEYKCFYL